MSSDPVDENGYPILDAVRVKDPKGDLLAVFCRYCNRDHHHGGGTNPGDGNGHRIAHCHINDSPYRTSPQSGYVLREVPFRENPPARFSIVYAQSGMRRPVSGFLRARERWLKQTSRGE